MNGIGRISFKQSFGDIRSNILNSQSDYVTNSLQLNSGERFLDISEDPAAVKDLTSLANRILEAEETASVKSSVESILEISEKAIGDIKELMDQIKTDAVYASNATSNDQDREAFADVLKSVTENIFSLANSKVNGQYIFSGKHSDKRTIDFNENDLFSNIEYLESTLDKGPKQIYDTQSSIMLDTVFNSTAASAQIISQAATPATITDGGDLRLVIDNGNGSVFDTGDIALVPGQAMFPPAAGNVVDTINNAANLAGLQGAIVQENPAGFLEFNTNLITNSVDNEGASITISNGTTINNTTVLEDFNIIAQKASGESKSLQETLESLFQAYKINDVEAIRANLIDIDANVNRLIDKQTLAGALTAQFADSRFADEDQVTQLKVKKSAIQDIPIAEAVVEANQAKLVMDTLLRNTNTIVNANIFNFLNI